MAVSFRKIIWTQHSELKMRQYGLSKQKLLGILRKPERKEKGIVPATTAVMRTNKKFGNKSMPWFSDKAKNPPKFSYEKFMRPRAPGEIWLMYKDVKSQKLGQIRKIISAWRYPGISKPGEEIPPGHGIDLESI